jgi:hypothetical protein
MAINLAPTGKSVGYKGKAKKTKEVGPGLVTGQDVSAIPTSETGSLIGGRPPAPGNEGEAEFDSVTKALLGVIRTGSQMEDSTERAINNIQESWDETLAKADAGPPQ